MQEIESRRTTRVGWRKPAAFASATVLSLSAGWGLLIDHQIRRNDAYNEENIAEKKLDQALDKYGISRDDKVAISELPTEVLEAGENLRKKNERIISLEDWDFSKEGLEQPIGGVLALSGVLLGALTWVSASEAARLSTSKKTSSGTV